jgi:hypothetical protein
MIVLKERMSRRVRRDNGKMVKATLMEHVRSMVGAERWVVKFGKRMEIVTITTDTNARRQGSQRTRFAVDHINCRSRSDIAGHVMGDTRGRK